MPVPPLLKIGAWENGKFIGVVIFSRGANNNLLKPYGLKINEGCELTRIALTKHEATVSKILSIAIKFLKKSNPKLRLIVSFADPNHGHHGGVYQATNWVYCGEIEPGFSYFDANGKRWHSRQVSEKGYNIQQGKVRKAVKPSECVKVKQQGKHRYLFPLDNSMKDQIEHLRKDYPKRAVSIDSDAPTFQVG